MPGPSSNARRKGKRLPSRWGMFIRGFIKHPVMVGAVAYSSKAVVRRMLKKCDWDNCRLVVEYGPGVGTFTQPILDRMRPDAKLIAIDTNPDFIAYLQESIDDPRLVPILGSAADVEKYVRENGFEAADYIVSGLPFSTLPAGVGDSIAAATKRILKPGGAFLVYQYNPRVRRFLDPHFDRIDHEVELRNLPPNQLWWAWKD